MFFLSSLSYIKQPFASDFIDQVEGGPRNNNACLFSVHNTISLSRHEQVCLVRLSFEGYFSHHRATQMIMLCINLRMLVMYLLRLYNGEPLYETIRQ